MLTLEQKKELLSLARNAISARFKHQSVSLPEDPAFSPKWQKQLLFKTRVSLL